MFIVTVLFGYNDVIPVLTDVLEQLSRATSPYTSAKPNLDALWKVIGVADILVKY